MRQPAVVASVSDLDVDGTAEADVLELRLDLGETTAEVIRRRAEITPLIVTNRPTWAGGRAGAGPDRLGALAGAIEAAPLWGVDLEYAVLAGHVDDAIRSAGDRVATLAAAAGVRVICSVHEPDDPADLDLLALARATATHGDVGKLAIAPETPRAFGALATAMAAVRDEGLPVACMAVGRYGPPSRALAIALDEPLVYGHPAGAPPTAAGQLPIGQLRTLANAFKTVDAPPPIDDRPHR